MELRKYFEACERQEEKKKAEWERKKQAQQTGRESRDYKYPPKKSGLPEQK